MHATLEWSITKWKKIKFVESILHIAYFLPLGDYCIPAKFQLDLMKFRGRSKLHIYIGLWKMLTLAGMAYEIVFVTAHLVFAFVLQL